MQTAGPQKGLAGDVLDWDQGGWGVVREGEWDTRKVNKLLSSREARRGESFRALLRWLVVLNVRMNCSVIVAVASLYEVPHTHTHRHTYTSGPQSQSGSKITDCQNRRLGIQRAGSLPLFFRSCSASPYNFLFLPLFLSIPIPTPSPSHLIFAVLPRVWE